MDHGPWFGAWGSCGFRVGGFRDIAESKGQGAERGGVDALLGLLREWRRAKGEERGAGGGE